MARSLHPDNDPNLLRGPEDWATWKWKKQAKINSLDLSEIIYGRRPRPVIGQENFEQEELNAWDIDNGEAMAMLAEDIHPRVARTLTPCQTAAQLWSALTATYESRSESNQHALITKFHDYKYASGTKIRDYISKKTDLAAACRNSGLEISERYLVATILGGLPPEFKPVILALESKPAAEKTLNEVTTFLVRNEMIDETAKANSSQANPPNNANNNAANANEQSAALNHGVRGGRGGGRNSNNHRFNQQNQQNRQNFQNGQQQPFYGRCGNCNKVGTHRAAECRAPPQNFRNNFNRNNNNRQQFNNRRINPQMQRQNFNKPNYNNFNQQPKPNQFNQNRQQQFQNQNFNQQGANYAGIGDGNNGNNDNNNNMFGRVGCWSFAVRVKVSALNAT